MSFSVLGGGGGGGNGSSSVWDELDWELTFDEVFPILLL